MKNTRKNIKNMQKIAFLGPKAPSGAQMLVSGAWGARNQHFKINGLFFCRSGLIFRNIWPRQRPNIWKNGQKIINKMLFWARTNFALTKDPHKKRQVLCSSRSSQSHLLLYVQADSLQDFLYKRPKKTIFPSFFHDFFGIFWVPREAALAADLITA